MLIPINDVPPESLNAEILGGKGFGLAWMTSNGVNVPPALVIPTSVCLEYQKKPKTVMAELKKQLPEIRKFFNEQLGYMPLLSVRSGARVSMPGMMDTILNVGLDPKTLPFWEEKIGKDCTENCRIRLEMMYGKVVLGMDEEQVLETIDFLPDTNGQILGAIEAVFKSWNNERAKIYRKLNKIPDAWGTACVLQAMVFGNAGDTSCTGVLFSRNPDTGENVVTGEFLINAQGEDVVDGSHTPLPLPQMEAWNTMVYHELTNTALLLEKLRGDVQDIEFTVQEGKLYILQTRNAKRSAVAALRIALDMHPGEQVFQKVSYADFLKAQQDQIDPKFKTKPWNTGLGACSGVATGKIVFKAEDAVKAKDPVILVTNETTPDDIAGMVAAKGILTMHGGSTSHAAVVARSMNRVCVVGLGLTLEDFTEGDTISIDGATGRVWKGEVPVISGAHQPAVQELRDRMMAHTQVKLIAEANAPMLDLSDSLYDPKTLGLKVIEALKTYDQVIVDLTVSTEHPWETWTNMFGQPPMEAALNAILGDLNDEQLARVRFLYRGPKYTGQRPVQLIAEVKDLEDLVMVEGDYVEAVSTKISPAFQKVLDWKFSQGVTPMKIGKVTPGGYASPVQVAKELLK